MAANPFDAFDSSPAANPFDSFDAMPAAPVAAPAAAPVTMPTALTPDVIDPNASTGSKLLSLLHNASARLGLSTQAAQDYATYGGADVLQSQLPSSPSLDQLRAQTQQAHAAMGAGDIPIGLATGMVGPGLKAPAMAADLARAATGGSKLAGWGAGALASGGMGAGSAGLGTLGHGGSVQDILSSAKLGGGIGLGLGMLGVGSAKAGAPLASKSTAALQAESDAARADMTPYGFYGSDVRQAYDDARAALTPAQRGGISPTLNRNIRGQQAQIPNTSLTSADTINGFGRRIFRGAQNEDDIALATKIRENLHNNVLGSTPPVTGQPAGEALKLNTVANQATQNLKNSQMIDAWRQAAALPGSGGIGEEAITGAQAALKNKPYYYTDPNVNAAMQNVASAGSSLPGSWLFKHSVGYPLASAAVGAIGGGVHGYESGSADPWSAALREAAEFGTVGFLTGYGLPGARSALARRAINAAEPALTQGAPFGPPAGSDLLRAWLFSRGAKGAGY